MDIVSNESVLQQVNKERVMLKLENINILA